MGICDIFKGTLNKAHQRQQAVLLVSCTECVLSCGCGQKLFSETKLMIITCGVPRPFFYFDKRGCRVWVDLKSFGQK